MSITYQLLLLVAVLACVYLLIDVAKDRDYTELFRPLLRAIKRAWLQHNIDGWQRDIEQIQAQRENDLRAERTIAREIINARSQLLDL